MSGNRFEQYFHILNKWLMLRQKGCNLLPYFEDNLIESVAIYGMGALGERLYDELKLSSVAVSYAIDRMAKDKNISGLDIYGNEEAEYPKTDAIIVTPVNDYWEIVEQLQQKTDVPIISLEDIVEYVYGL